MKAKITYKGGKGSGNFGHSGRPGKVGGSGDSGSMIVYHGSASGNLNDILESGIQPGKSWFGRPPSVYYTTSREDAEKLANEFVIAERYVILEVRVPKSVVESAHVDSQGNRDFKIDSSYRIESPIPAPSIVSFDLYERRDANGNVQRYGMDVEHIQHRNVEGLLKEEIQHVYVIVVLEIPSTTTKENTQGVEDDDAMLAFMLDDTAKEAIKALQVSFPQGSVILKPEEWHITLKYFPRVDDEYTSKLLDVMEAVTSTSTSRNVTTSKVHIFKGVNGGKNDCVTLQVQPTQLRTLRDELLGKLEDIGIELPADTYPQYTPHITLAYIPVDGDYDVDYKSVPLAIDSVSYVQRDNVLGTFPLSGDEVLKELIFKGLNITQQSKDALFAVRQELFNETINTLSEQMFTGEISLGHFQETFKTELRQLHSSAAAISKGGWDRMEPSDWGRLGNPMKEQYQHLQGFVDYVSDNRDTISLQYIKGRSRLYGDSALASATLIEVPFQIHAILPWIPKDASTICRHHCHCHWELVVTKSVGDWQYVTATWRLGQSDHCETCVERDKHVVNFQVHRIVDVPTMIGGY